MSDSPLQPEGRLPSPRFALTLPEFQLVAAELKGLEGARVQKIHVPSHRSAFLDLRLPGESVLLLLAAEPENLRLGVVKSRDPAPPEPLAFQGLLRSHLSGGRLEKLRPADDDRWLLLEFDTPKGSRKLVLEWVGSNSNLLLLDDRDHILGFGLPSQRRSELGMRQLWIPPRAPERKGGEGGAEAPSLSKRLLPFFDAESGARFPVSAAIEQLVASPSPPAQLEQLRAQQLAPLNSALKRARRTLAKIQGDASRADQAERFRHFGELLKTQLHQVQKGARSVRLVDWSSPEQSEVEVPLDPALSPQANMQRYFHQHQRMTRNLGLIRERMELMKARVLRLEELLERGRKGDEAELFRLVELAREEGLLRSPAQGGQHFQRQGALRIQRRLPYREYRSRSGLRIRVGKNARDNDELSLKHSRGNDLWLHARGVTGSHVVLAGAGPSGPDDESVLDAATLAAHFSEMRGEKLVEVTTTQARYVRKPKGSPPGLVRYSNDKTILLRLEPERLSRVLDTLAR